MLLIEIFWLHHSRWNDGALSHLLSMSRGNVVYRNGVSSEETYLPSTWELVHLFFFFRLEGTTRSKNWLLQKPEVQRGRAPRGTTQHKEHYSAPLCRTLRNCLRSRTFCVVFHYQIKITLYRLLKIKSKKRSNNVAVCWWGHLWNWEKGL
jgi:hypothetical protein